MTLTISEWNLNIINFSIIESLSWKLYLSSNYFKISIKKDYQFIVENCIKCHFEQS